MEFPDLTQGRCREVGSEFFFPETENDTSMYVYGKMICSSCIVKQECLEWAIRHEGHGLWGGMTPRERMAERRKLNIQLESISTGDYV